MNKQSISFKADEQKLTKTGGIEHYASNIVAYIEATFDLGTNWNGYDSVRAVWSNDYLTDISTVLDNNGKCIVPTEVLTDTGNVTVNLVGSIADGGTLTDRLTTYPCKAVIVDADAKVEGDETESITPSQFEQFVEIVHDEVEQVTGMTAEAETLPAGSDATASYSDGVLSFGIPRGDKGEQGEQGETGHTGEPAGFGDVTASVDNTVGTPSVNVTASGPDTAKEFDFEFHNLKGEQGDTGETGATGNGIASTVLNPDYTLTITFTDGTSYTTPSIRGAKGDTGNTGATGNGIQSTVLNADYTLTITFTDGTSYTTPSIRGEQGPAGPVSDVTVNGTSVVDQNGVAVIPDTRGYIDHILATDFGINDTTVINGYNANNTAQTANGNAPFVLDKRVAAQNIITGIKLKALVTGTVSIGYLNAPVQSGDTYNANDLVTTNEVIIKTTGEQTVLLPNPFAVPANGVVFVGRKTDTAKWTYGTAADNGFCFAASSAYTHSGGSVGVDIIARPYADYSFILDNYPETKNIADMVESDMYSDISFYDGYNASNSSSSSVPLSPFMVPVPSAGYVSSYKLKIQGVGKLSIGVINASDVVEGQTFDHSKVTVHETFEFVSTGEQTHYLTTPMKVERNQYIALCVRTDGAIFAYGASGVDHAFYYVSGTKVVHTQNSLGVTFNGKKKIDSTTSDSIYYGKTISILGDSISTFDGYIPAGNVTYYPSGTVQAVTDTWWKKLIDALGMTLNVNNSWSGSRVTTTNGSASAGCGDRAEALGTSPDVIIVWMGINDFNNEVALGTYDGASTIPSGTTSFREAYAIMLNKILTKYQNAEVWVCTLPQCERNADTGFPEINGNGVALVEFNKAICELANAFGVKVLDHNKCGLTYQNMPTYNPDNLHPNKYGHSLVANNDIRQMDNYARTRY